MAVAGNGLVRGRQGFGANDSQARPRGRSGLGVHHGRLEECKRKDSTEEKKKKKSESRLERFARAPVDKVSQPPDLKGLSVRVDPLRVNSLTSRGEHVQWGKEGENGGRRTTSAMYGVDGLRTTRMADSVVYFHGGKRGVRLK